VLTDGEEQTLPLIWKNHSGTPSDPTLESTLNASPTANVLKQLDGAYPTLTGTDGNQQYYAWTYFAYGINDALVPFINEIQVEVTGTSGETLTLYATGTILDNLRALPYHQTVDADGYRGFG
jgi:hypothetical protein